MKVLLASKNEKKVKELMEILGDKFEVLCLNALERKLPDVKEDTDTFVGNAVKKATLIAHWTGLLCLADDSGLEVEALGGRPGVYSARFAGEEKNDLKNNKKVLELLKGVSNRRARFICYVAIADASGLIAVVSGSVWGRISEEMRGKEGFGYDPIFIPEGYKKTFAELGAEVKNQISHRKIALAKAVNLLKIYTSPL